MNRIALTIALCIALALTLLTTTAYAQRVPNCFPSITGVDMDGPHVRFGQHGIHVLWACRNATGTPLQVWGMSCRHETCNEAVWSAFVRRLTDISTFGKATRTQEAMRAWRAKVTVDCELMVLAPIEQVIEPARADWRMCLERQQFISAIYPPAK